MNFSLTSEKISNVTLQSYSREELLDQCIVLKNQYESLSKQYESIQQEVYETKKNYQCSLELKNHLTSEIETCQQNELIIKTEYEQKIRHYQDEMDILKQEKWKEIENNLNTIEALRSKIKDLEEFQNNITDDKTFTQMNTTKLNDDLKKLEEENENLKKFISEQNCSLIKYQNKMDVLKNQNKIHEENMECLKCNLETKKEELSSLTDMLHSAQEDICGLNSELIQYKNSTNTHAIKGNSLFAEVDDKRQEMMKSLSQMKEKVHQLNRELISKQAEIDSLLCEKKTLWEEYSGQASHHDAVLNRAYERRITDLEKQNNHLRKEITLWYNENINPNSSEITQWVSGVLDFYREENQRLSNEFAASSVDNLFKEQKLRDLQRQVVTWRTKTVESNAAFSQLQLKVQLSETNNSNNILNEKHKLTPLKENISHKKYSNINESNADNYNEKKVYEDQIEHTKEQCNKPGILVTGLTKNKTLKKTSFQ